MITICVIGLILLALAIVCGAIALFWKVLLVIGILTLIDVLVFKLIFKKEKKKEDEK